VELDVVQAADEAVGHNVRQASDRTRELAVFEVTQPSVPLRDQDRRVGQKLEAPGILETAGEHTHANLGRGRLILPRLIRQGRYRNAPAPLALCADATDHDGHEKRSDDEAETCDRTSGPANRCNHGAEITTRYCVGSPVVANLSRHIRPVLQEFWSSPFS
jgi:hypothetical protein